MTGQRVAGGDRPGRTAEPGFVDRERELTTLTEALADPPAVVLVEGEAGIGKTRLISEYLSSPSARDRRCLVVRCPPFRDPLTLGPMVDAVRAATDRVANLRLSGLAGALRPLLPEWADELPPAPEPLDDARASRHRLYRALAEILDRLGTDTLIVEDAHWADEATLDFLVFLLVANPAPVSLVLTYRPEDLPADAMPLSALTGAARRHVQRISLTPLTRDGTGELVSSMLDGEHVSDDFAAFLHRNTAGIPLVVEESVRLMRDRADLIRRDGEWVRRRLDGIDVPFAVSDAVLERVARLGTRARAVLDAAAVLAEPADEATLAAVSGFDGGTFAAGLLDALGSSLLREDSDGLVSYRHALAAQAVYETIPARRGRELHLAAGRSLEDRSSWPVARLAHHFRQAGEMTAWFRYAERAAQAALASADYTTAIVLMRDMLIERPEPSVVWLADQIPFERVSATDRSVELAAAIRSVLGRTNLSPGEEARVRFQLGRLLMLVEDFEAGKVEMTRAIPGLDDPVVAARAMRSLALPHGPTGSGSAHLRWLRSAARTDPHPARLASQIDHVSRLLLLGREEGWAETAALPEWADTTRERGNLAAGWVNVGDAHRDWGRYQRARACLDRARALVDPLREPGVVDLIRSTRLHVDWFTGDWSGLAESALDLAGDRDAVPKGRSEALLVSGWLSLAAGDHDLAEERLGSIVAEWRTYPEPLLEATAVLARCQLRRGRYADAVRLTDESLRVVARKGVWVWAGELAPVRVEALLAVDRTEEAEDLVARFARGLRGRDAPAPRVALALCRALLAETRDPVRAGARYLAVAAAYRDLPRPYDALLADERHAHCLLDADRATHGIPLLETVFSGLSELGARGDAERVMRALRERGVAVKRPSWLGGRRSYGDQLSPRELDVVRLVVTGRTNRQIATELVLSPKTVASHVDRAMRKLGVPSRAALAARAVETRLTGTESATR